MAHAEVTEEGTLAAVAAWARVAQGELPAYIPVQFRADHPFIFLIQDTESGNTQFGPGCRSVTEGKRTAGDDITVPFFHSSPGVYPHVKNIP
jgi:hypothetical protein